MARKGLHYSNRNWIMELNWYFSQTGILPSKTRDGAAFFFLASWRAILCSPALHLCVLCERRFVPKLCIFRFSPEDPKIIPSKSLQLAESATTFR